MIFCPPHSFFIFIGFLHNFESLLLQRKEEKKKERKKAPPDAVALQTYLYYAWLLYVSHFHRKVYGYNKYDVSYEQCQPNYINYSTHYLLYLIVQDKG